MSDATLVVFSRPLAGRDDEFNDWYTHIHLRDALRFRGSIAAQRFSLGAIQPAPLPSDFTWRYLALYEVFDPKRFSLEHWENALTPRMKITDAFDDTVLEDYHYYPLQTRNAAPERSPAGGVIVEQMAARPGCEAEFERWYGDTYFPGAVARAGIQSGAFLVFRSVGQMLPTTPRHRHIAIYRMDQPGGVPHWPGHDATADGLLDRSTTLVTAWEPMTARLTRDQVAHTDAAALAQEERARARMGDRLLGGGREKLQVG